MYLSEEPTLKRLEVPDLEWKGLFFGHYDENQYRKAVFFLVERQPSRLYAHIYAIKQSFNGNVRDDVLYARKPLAGTMKTQSKQTHNLLSEQAQNEEKEETIEYWYPDLDISVVQDASSYDLTMLHPLAVRQMQLNGDKYQPILYLNDFWHIKSKRVPINDDTKELKLNITLTPISLYKYQLLLSFDHSFRINEQLLNSDDSLGGVDSIKVCS